MKINPFYVLRYLDGHPYLLPYGQAIAEHCRGIRLNETGVRIWKALQSYTDEKELYHFLKNSYAEEGIFCDSLAEDLTVFLDKLSSLHIVDRSILRKETGRTCLENTAAKTAYSGHICRIGNILMDYQGPLSLFPKELEAFLYDSEFSKPDLVLKIHSSPNNYIENDTILLRTSQLTICKGADHYSLLYPANFAITECRISLDCSSADFYCRQPFNSELQEQLFHSIRFAYLAAAQQKQLFALHSASILYHGRAILFSGPSGMGKSTHTNLWNELFQVPVLNGDLNLIGLNQGQPIVYGLPWCGTSGISTASQYPLGAVVMLKKHSSDTCRKLSGAEKTLMLSHRLISPSWTADQLDQNLEFSACLASLTPVFQLCCTKASSAVHLIKTELDNFFMEHPDSADLGKI